jgi:hypothetical protein
MTSHILSDQMLPRSLAIITMFYFTRYYASVVFNVHNQLIKEFYFNKTLFPIHLIQLYLRIVDDVKYEIYKIIKIE